MLQGFPLGEEYYSSSYRYDKNSSGNLGLLLKSFDLIIA
jgi:hypothetical protein